MEKTFYRLIKPYGFSNSDFDTLEEAHKELNDFGSTVDSKYYNYWQEVKKQCKIVEVTEITREIFPKEGFKIGQELEFNTYGTVIKGKFLSMLEEKVITIEVTYDSSDVTDIGYTANVHESFLVPQSIQTNK